MFTGLVSQEYLYPKIIAKEGRIIHSDYTMTMKQCVLLLKLENKPQHTSSLIQSTIPTYSTRYVQGKNPDAKLTGLLVRTRGLSRNALSPRSPDPQPLQFSCRNVAKLFDSFHSNFTAEYSNQSRDCPSSPPFRISERYADLRPYDATSPVTSNHPMPLT